jgi:FixJ family two-component response regulator
MNSQTTVFLVDDDDAVRDSLTLLFETAGLAVEAYSSAETFLDAYRPERPGCLVLDVSMPGMSGTELQTELGRRDIQVPIIFLTAHGNIPMTVRAIKAGAVDFLTKPVQVRPLLERVQAAITQDFQQRERLRTEPAAAASLATLTPRELEVAKLLVGGRTNKEIARNLGISHRTVENHRARVMEKTHTANLIELARLMERQPAEARVR